MSEAPIVLESKNLCKRFGATLAVDHVSFKIQQGAVVGFVGRNGAGKTTTLRMLMGLETPSSGETFICGENVRENPRQARNHVGWMPDTNGMYGSTTVWEYLDFFARAYGLVGLDRRNKVDRAVERTDLQCLLDRETTTLSRGEAQHLSLARALLQEPKVLLLDEPAAGLDPEARLNFKTLVRSLAKQGTTCLISSHILSELAEMCDEFLFLHRGKIIRRSSVKDLLREGNVVVRVRARSGVFHPHVLPSLRWDFLSEKSIRIYLSDAREETLANLLKSLILSGIEITEFVLEERNLEEIFLETLQRGECES